MRRQHAPDPRAASQAHGRARGHHLPREVATGHQRELQARGAGAAAAADALQRAQRVKRAPPVPACRQKVVTEAVALPAGAAAALTDHGDVQRVERGGVHAHEQFVGGAQRWHPRFVQPQLGESPVGVHAPGGHARAGQRRRRFSRQAGHVL